jgi:hypothetical protein|tara:strand:- start:2023 stop:2688 length:666 start_codon:yes stop_codon:yes gene_type:complete
MENFTFPSIDNVFEKSFLETYGVSDRPTVKSKGLMARSQEGGRERVMREMQNSPDEPIKAYIYDKTNPAEYARFFADVGMGMLDLIKAPPKGVLQGTVGVVGDTIELLGTVADVVSRNATVQEFSEIGKKLMIMSNIDVSSGDVISNMMDKFPTSVEVKKHFDDISMLETEYAQPLESLGEFFGLSIYAKGKQILSKGKEKTTQVLQDIKKTIKKPKKGTK